MTSLGSEPCPDANADEWSAGWDPVSAELQANVGSPAAEGVTPDGGGDCDPLVAEVIETEQELSGFVLERDFEFSDSRPRGFQSGDVSFPALAVDSLCNAGGFRIAVGGAWTRDDVLRVSACRQFGDGFAHTDAYERVVAFFSLPQAFSHVEVTEAALQILPEDEWNERQME